MRNQEQETAMYDQPELDIPLVSPLLRMGTADPGVYECGEDCEGDAHFHDPDAATYPEPHDSSNEIMRQDMEQANRSKARSLRDLGHDAVEQELRGMRIPDRAHAATVRLRATIVAKSQKWCEVGVELSLHPEEWHELVPPTLVYRQGDMTAESRSVYAISLIKQVLGETEVNVALDRGSLRLGAADVEEWSWWAHLQSRLSVAVQVRGDNSVRVVGLR